MIVFPAVAAGVSALFAVQLFAQYARRKRLPQLAWGIAMSMFALASLAVAAGGTGGWDPTLYRVYWLFGALLNVPYLALGSVALLNRRALSALALLLVLAASVIAVIAVASSSVDLPVQTKQIPRGSDVWGNGTLAARLPRYTSIPAYVIVVVIAVAGGRSRLSAARVRGNRLIALGTTIVAVGGPLARYGRGSVFSVTLATGVTVMFLGFRLTSRQARPTNERLVLYSSSDCHLCEQAREALARIDLSYEEVEVPDGHPYRLRTPVLEAGGVVVAEGEIDEALLARVFRVPPPRPR